LAYICQVNEQQHAMNTKPTITEAIESVKEFNATIEQLLDETAAMIARMEAAAVDIAKLKRQVSAEKGRRTKATRYW